MKKYISVFAIMIMIFLAACSNQNISSTPTAMRAIHNLTVLQNWKRVFGLRMNTQRGFLFRLVRLHGQHLIQNMRIAVSTLPALAKTTITSTWRF